MDSVAQFALVTLTSLLFIVDPIAVVPAYLVITRGETPAEQRRRAMRACIAMTVLLIVFAATGNMIFRAFGITLSAFRTAGGLILWYVTMDMLHGERRTQEGQEEVHEDKRKKTSRLRRWRFRCLPGPARFSTVIVLSSEARTTEELLIV